MVVVADGDGESSKEHKMNARRINLIGCVRAALEAAGISTVKVVNAVNAKLGQLDCVGTESKLGHGRVGKSLYKVSESTTSKYQGEIDIALRFDAWHSAMAKADKIGEMDNCYIPVAFSAWLQSMKEKAPAPEPAPAPAPAANALASAAAAVSSKAAALAK